LNQNKTQHKTGIGKTELLTTPTTTTKITKPAVAKCKLQSIQTIMVASLGY
jgi:hypothetical protein